MFLWMFKPPKANELPEENPLPRLDLDRLTPGVDNNRFDVSISPFFMRGARMFVMHVLSETAMPSDVDAEKRSAGVHEKDQFKDSYRALMQVAIHQAKQRREIQVDHLCRAAVAGILIREIRSCFDQYVSDMRRSISEREMTRGTYRDDGDDPAALKAALSDLLMRKNEIIRKVGRKVFSRVREIEETALDGMRSANFGASVLLPPDLFLNPLLHTERVDDFFMMETYDILTGQRIDDADRYDRILSILQEGIREIKGDPPVDVSGRSESEENKDADGTPESPSTVDHPPNRAPQWDPAVLVRKGEVLFDYVTTREEIQWLKKEGGDPERLQELKDRYQMQNRMVMLFFRKFARAKIIKRICAAYEIRSLLPLYCPPLAPQVILQYMMTPASRKVILQRLKRLARINQVPFSRKPLNKCRRRIEGLTFWDKKRYVSRFLCGFFNYHRDRCLHRMISSVTAGVNLVTDENHARLSRVNNTLYAFLMDHEETREEAPVIAHTILKADIRGSTDMVHGMKEKGLNPATYFSLNMFDPITEIIPEYDAFKVFIEGDAMILGIYEREGVPEGWYGIARACGLAVQIQRIIHRYNRKNIKLGLPLIEIGIGISLREGAPTLFYDGDFEIMISPAINEADRLSGSSKAIRKRMDDQNRPFCNYVFQTATDEEVAATSDDISTRYNVNGIELHADAFRKLSREISLRPVYCEIPSVQHGKMQFYKGTFPTVTGRYETIIIREDRIPRVHKKTLEPISLTSRHYYEVCTNAAVHNYFNKYEL